MQIAYLKRSLSWKTNFTVPHPRGVIFNLPNYFAFYLCLSSTQHFFIVIYYNDIETLVNEFLVALFAEYRSYRNIQNCLLFARYLIFEAEHFCYISFVWKVFRNMKVDLDGILIECEIKKISIISIVWTVFVRSMDE